MSKLIITDVAIRQDSHNRYCLNDLHKAAGNENKHKTANWLRQQQVIDLIELLEYEQSTEEHRVIFVKQGVGTFAVKELVYAYAMWISPVFNLQVIRAYDALVTGDIPEHIVKAYDEMVTHKIPEYLNVISKPMSVFEFEERHAFHETALENLKNAHIIISAKDFLSRKRDKNL